MDFIVPDQEEFPALVLPWANVGDIKWKKKWNSKKIRDLSGFADFQNKQPEVYTYRLLPSTCDMRMEYIPS